LLKIFVTAWYLLITNVLLLKVETYAHMEPTLLSLLISRESVPKYCWCVHLQHNDPKFASACIEAGNVVLLIQWSCSQFHWSKISTTLNGFTPTHTDFVHLNVLGGAFFCVSKGLMLFTNTIILSSNYVIDAHSRIDANYAYCCV
jgi:hypothetical protein